MRERYEGLVLAGVITRGDQDLAAGASVGSLSWPASMTKLSYNLARSYDRTVTCPGCRIAKGAELLDTLELRQGVNC